MASDGLGVLVCWTALAPGVAASFAGGLSLTEAGAARSCGCLLLLWSDCGGCLACGLVEIGAGGSLSCSAAVFF